MTHKPTERVACRRIELDGLRYVIVRESVFEKVCRRAGISRRAFPDEEEPGFDLDGAALAERLVLRRRAAGLSQTALARRAGIRPETLNRIERGRTTPDFATIRKLVLAMNAAENQEDKEDRHDRE
jgi:ribosome-binding protein aMBF1 (putative translation factor)